jgi:hypothetical protein
MEVPTLVVTISTDKASAPGISTLPMVMAVIAAAVTGVAMAEAAVATKAGEDFTPAYGERQERRRTMLRPILLGRFPVDPAPARLLKVLLDVVEFVLTALLATVILIFDHPALGIAFVFALITFVILIARWAGE